MGRRSMIDTQSHRTIDSRHFGLRLPDVSAARRMAGGRPHFARPIPDIRPRLDGDDRGAGWCVVGPGQALAGMGLMFAFRWNTFPGS
jgi:hypothetical protein